MIENLRWKKFEVLDDGFVCLVDWMGSDDSVVQAARVSYGKDMRVSEMILGSDGKTPVDDITKESRRKVAEQDRNLIRYLWRHQHTTPFEMCEVKLLVRVPMDCWRQWIRHRMASVNEYSTRYTEAIDSCQKVPRDAWRLQSSSNKQGSTGFLREWPNPVPDLIQHNMICNEPDDYEDPGHWLDEREDELHKLARDVYQERLLLGVAKEQARKDLPLSTYTEAYWKIDLKNLLNFLSLRMDSHAQQEIRSYADIIGNEIVAKLFPICWEAFNDYDPRRGAMTLSALDIKVVSYLLKGCDLDTAFGYVNWPSDAKCRERDECLAKLCRLGIVDDKILSQE